jgi:hypothetical protein
MMDFLWNQIYMCMVERRAPAYGPFIMKVISYKWAQKHEGKRIEDSATLTTHFQWKLNIKVHPPPLAPGETAALSAAAAAAARMGTSAGLSEGVAAQMGLGGPSIPMYDPMYEPSWYQKLKIKVKKTFCLQLDLQERMYQAHVAEKKARQR